MITFPEAHETDQLNSLAQSAMEDLMQEEFTNNPKSHAKSKDN